jgi:two-component system LytT family response regulator
VNVARIRELRPLFSGEYDVILEGGTALTLSRNYKDRLFRLLGRPL